MRHLELNETNVQALKTATCIWLLNSSSVPKKAITKLVLAIDDKEEYLSLTRDEIYSLHLTIFTENILNMLTTDERKIILALKWKTTGMLAKDNI